MASAPQEKAARPAALKRLLAGGEPCIGLMRW